MHVDVLREAGQIQKLKEWRAGIEIARFGPVTKLYTDVQLQDSFGRGGSWVASNSVEHVDGADLLLVYIF